MRTQVKLILLPAFANRDQELVDVLRKLEDRDELSGVIDDRGKYVYIRSSCELCFRHDLLQSVRNGRSGSIYQTEGACFY